VNADATERPSMPVPARMSAHAIAAAAAGRLLLELPRCCADGPYAWLFLAILGSLAWGAVVLWATAAFLAPPVGPGRRATSRVGLALLGVVVAAIGAEAFWTLAAAVAQPLVGEVIELVAVSWTAACAVLIRRRWRQLSATHRQAG